MRRLWLRNMTRWSMFQHWLYMVDYYLGETGWNNHFNYRDHCGRKEKGHLAGKGWLDELQHMLESDRSKPDQTPFDSSTSVSSAYHLFLLLFICRCFSFSVPPHHHRLTRIYPWLELISRLSTTMPPTPHTPPHPPARHMRPWGDLLSWLPPFFAQEEAAGDMLTWEETLSSWQG